MATLTISKEDEKRVKAMGFLSNKGTDNFSARVITVNGRISAEQYMAIGEAAQKYGDGNLVFTTRLTVEVPGIPYEKIEAFKEFIESKGLTTGGTGSKVRPVVSCKGTTCQYGLIDTYDLSTKIHKAFYEGYRQVKLPHKFKIAVGGCPNNCVKPDLNDMGIIGQLVPNFDEDMCNGCKRCSIEKVCPIGAARVVDGVLEIDKNLCNNCGRCVGNCHFDAIEDGTPGYKIYIGGRWGKSVAKGQELRKIFSSEEEVMSAIEKTILLFREQGKTGERFAQTIDRLGFDHVEKEILSDDILSRKEEILNAKLHETGGATC
ncbi:MAG: (4Fe-4S)-binding protein [Lachnospiraceae bacterium]|nr:(4Fe-4S)-binding protein [Lachnospiraceae bacterium]